jgi:hypothetical protein
VKSAALVQAEHSPAACQLEDASLRLEDPCVNLKSLHEAMVALANFFDAARMDMSVTARALP